MPSYKYFGVFCVSTLREKRVEYDDDDKKGHPFKPIYIFNVSKLV